MKKYRIKYTVKAIQDIENSFEWGCEHWGEVQAKSWYASLKTKIQKQLSISPRGRSLAPESPELGREIRQMIHERYRILYEIINDTVSILSVRGSYNESDQSPVDDS